MWPLRCTFVVGISLHTGNCPGIHQCNTSQNMPPKWTTNTRAGAILQINTNTKQNHARAQLADLKHAVRKLTKLFVCKKRSSLSAGCTMGALQTFLLLIFLHIALTREYQVQNERSQTRPEAEPMFRSGLCTSCVPWAFKQDWGTAVRSKLSQIQMFFDDPCSFWHEPALGLCLAVVTETKDPGSLPDSTSVVSPTDVSASSPQPRDDATDKGTNTQLNHYKICAWPFSQGAWGEQWFAVGYEGCPRILRCTTTSRLLVRCRSAAVNSWTALIHNQGKEQQNGHFWIVPFVDVEQFIKYITLSPLLSESELEKILEDKCVGSYSNVQEAFLLDSCLFADAILVTLALLFIVLGVVLDVCCLLRSVTVLHSSRVFWI